MTSVGTKMVARFPWWSGPLLAVLKTTARLALACGWQPSEETIDRLGTSISKAIAKHIRFTCE